MRAPWVMAGLLITGCAPALRPADPRPAASLAFRAPFQSPATASELAWSSSRPLTWEDFRGKPPTDGEEQARTVYLLSFESRCRGVEFTFNVTALMLPTQSWVKPFVQATQAGGVRVLRHEQTHFDLTEIYARRMRRFFKDLYDPCGQPDERLREAVDRYVKEESDAQGRYDSETQYGRNDQAQARWDHDVSEMLSSLAAFEK